MQLFKTLLMVVSCLGGYSTAAAAPIDQLPQDAHRWYITVVGETDNPAYQNVLRLFAATEEMRTLASQVHFITLSPDSPIFKERYAQGDFAISATPAVRVQTDTGEVVYQAEGNSLSVAPETLYAAIATSVEKHRLRQRRQVEPEPFHPIQPVHQPIVIPVNHDGPPLVLPHHWWQQSWRWHPEIPAGLSVLALALGVGLIWGIGSKLRGNND